MSDIKEAVSRVPAGVVHAALAVGGFAIGTTEFATMSLVPQIARDLAIDAPTAGHLISAYALGVVVGAPLIATLTARMSRSRLLILLMTVFAAAHAASALAPSYGWMLLFRFFSGLPHGAYFGISALVAAQLVPAEQRVAAVGRVLLGLTIATIIGVPLANYLGHGVGWRWSFGLVAGLAATTAALVAWLVPRDLPDPLASPWRELGALTRPQVWLTLAIAAIGFGGCFAVYTYLASTLTAVTHASAGAAPFVFAAFGIGMTAGNLIVPRFAGRSLMGTACALLLWSALSLALYSIAAEQLWSVTLDMFAIGLGCAMGPVLQTRLMDVAEDSQALAAALHHAAFNFANALGPMLGGLAINAGFGWTSTGLVGSALALAGLGVWAQSARLDAASSTQPVTGTA
jgi:MFS transporter, DHA1 family, inner membrane transport protein